MLFSSKKDFFAVLNAHGRYDEGMSVKRTVLITAGPTREYFDPVRFISNPSSGKMGFSLARAALANGWRVHLVAGPVAIPPPEGCRVTPVVTGEDMLKACLEIFPACDLLIKTAAVCDFRPKHRLNKKYKKTGEGMTVEFEPVCDILKTLANLKRPDQRVVGFAAETDNVEAYARKKLAEKKLDYIVANRVGVPNGGFEADSNAVCILGADGSRRELGPAPKQSLAVEIFNYLTESYGR